MKPFRPFLAALLLLALCWVGCSKFLEESSPNDVDAATAIRDAASAEAALLGCYSALQHRHYYGGQYPLMSEPLCNNAATGGYSYLSLDQLGEKSVTPANILVEQTWIALYRVVANCNRLLDALPNVSDLDAERRKALEGQARAMRALVHLDVLRYFGEHWASNSAFGIPVITTVQTIDDKPRRSTVADTYKAIFDDLNQAAALLLPDETAPQYINLHTVYGLLARTYLFQGNRAKAAEYASKVIENPAFVLLDAADYTQVYTSRRTTECIFELAFDAQNRSDFNNLTYGRDDAIRPELSFMASKSLDDFFKARSGDVRANTTNFDPADNDATIIPDGRSQKYRGEADKDNPAYILRLAEMHLIRAEALGLADGLDDLNLLRTKRGLSPLTQAELPSNDAFLRAILDERRAEFNFEGLYFTDLARTQKAADVLGVEPFRAILPIPNREIAASGGNLTQNPGY